MRETKADLERGTFQGWELEDSAITVTQMGSMQCRSLPWRIFSGMDAVILKFTWKCKDPRRVKEILRINHRAEGLTSDTDSQLQWLRKPGRMADDKTEQTHKHIFHLVKSCWTAKPSLGEVLLLTNDRGSITFRGEKMSPSSLYTKENCK